MVPKNDSVQVMNVAIMDGGPLSEMDKNNLRLVANNNQLAQQDGKAGKRISQPVVAASSAAASSSPVPSAIVTVDNTMQNFNNLGNNGSGLPAAFQINELIMAQHHKQQQQQQQQQVAFPTLPSQVVSSGSSASSSVSSTGRHLSPQPSSGVATSAVAIAPTGSMAILPSSTAYSNTIAQKPTITQSLVSAGYQQPLLQQPIPGSAAISTSNNLNNNLLAFGPQGTLQSE